MELRIHDRQKIISEKGEVMHLILDHLQRMMCWEMAV
jgi:hypothetical protein